MALRVTGDFLRAAGWLPSPLRHLSATTINPQVWQQAEEQEKQLVRLKTCPTEEPISRRRQVPLPARRRWKRLGRS